LLGFFEVSEGYCVKSLSIEGKDDDDDDDTLYLAIPSVSDDDDEMGVDR